MAKPISFTKRDLEKKKQEKRLAKQQKKEERKNSGTSSFEDMIAYVDETGRTGARRKNRAFQCVQRIRICKRLEECRKIFLPYQRIDRQCNRKQYRDF